MPPRLAKKTAIAKRRVSIATASSRKVEVVPPPCTDSPPAAIGETTAPETDSFLGKDQTGKSDPIMTEEGESLQSDKVSRSRAAKRRAVVKVAASMVKKEAVASVARDQIEQKTGSLLDKEVETEKSESVKDEKDGTVEEPVEEEENIEIIGVEKEIEEEPVKKEVQDEGEKIEKAETEELTNREEIEEGEPVGEEQVEEEEPIEEEPMEEGEPVEEEPVEEEEPIEEEPVEGGGEEEPVEEEEPMEQEPIEEEPMEEEEEEEEVEEVEEEDEEEVEEEEEDELEEEEEDELEEEEEEEEVGKGDGKVELIQGTNNEEKRDIVAVKDVQPASVYGGGGEGEDQGLDDVPKPTMYMKALLPNRKVKETQIFISQLEKTVVEEDIAKVFAKFGEIQSIRVIRHSLTQKSKGYAFLQYSTAEAVEKALCQLKDGTEIKGKTVHISASNQENCTLFVGNICKSWSKDQVLDALKGLGVEGIEQIALPEDPKIEGKSKGFAFVEFCTHIDAKAALNHLCKPDAVLGCDFSAKVSFAQLSVNHSEELLAKVKTVYLEPVPTSWDGKKIEEICKEYGAIEKIKLYRKSNSKKKDFAFVEFVSRESALNCVEGLNKAPVGHGDTKVSASIARPYARKTGMKFMIRGNFKVKKSNEKVEMKEVKIIKSSDEKVEKEEVKIIEVSGETKKKCKRPKLKDVIYQKPKALSPKKKIKKNKKLHKKVPNVETHKEAPHRHAPKEGHNKEAPVPIQPQGSKKRLFKKAPESSRRLTKGKMKHEKGTQGGPHPHQSGTKKPKPFKGSKQHQRGGSAFNNERAFKKSRNDHYGDHNHGSPIDRCLSVEYAYAPPPYTSSIHEPHYTSRIHEPHYTSRIHEPHYTSRIHEPPYTSRIHEPSRHEPPYISRTHEPSRHEPYAYVSGSYHPHRSDLAPHEGYVPPTHHAPRTRHVYEPSAPAPYDGGYDRVIVYTREPPIPPTSHPGNVTYPRYQQPSYPYPIGGSYPADYAPRRSYY